MLPKIFRENRNTYLINNIFFSENHSVYEIKWKNILERDRPQKIRRMRIACRTIKATNTHTHTHTQYVIPIALVLQQRLAGTPLNVTLKLH